MIFERFSTQLTKKYGFQKKKTQKKSGYASFTSVQIYNCLLSSYIILRLLKIFRKKVLIFGKNILV